MIARSIGLIVKRALDIALALLGLVLFSPILLTVAVLVRRRLGTPVFFTQERPGLHGKPFRMIKFRSMTDARRPDGSLKSDAERLTAFGQRLRSSSLDELPELWNILMGDMSIVGPRPLLMKYLPLYNDRQRRRHEVRPGITGWAQINGRNAITWEQKFEFDVWYVENRSLWLDVKIFFLTVSKVFGAHGITAEGEMTAREFTGSANDTPARG
jgi:lipopolysaccharide/colanic/teichoic acid biosynthesis glycosyltransferase